jgi:hypothetical protein
VFGISAEDKADIALVTTGGNVNDALLEESIVAQIRTRIVRHWGEEYYAGKLEIIREIDGEIESGIIERTLRALHPVDDTSSASCWIAAMTRRDPCSVFFENRFDCGHGIEMTIPEPERGNRSSLAEFPTVQIPRQQFEQRELLGRENRIGDGESFGYGGHVVHPHDVCSLENTGCDGGNGSIQTTNHRSIFGNFASDLGPSAANRASYE